MRDVREVLSRLIEISEVRMPGGWRGWVAVREAGAERFSKSQWEAILAEPEKLTDGAERTLKSEGRNTVVVKYLTVGGRGVRAVIKRHVRGRGVREFFRLMAAPKGLRNFIAAVKIRQYGLPVAAPLAGVYRRTFLFCRQSIYISEYVEGVNLHQFLKNLLPDSSQRRRVMSRISEQLAEILAELHNNGLWHRDAKATNFVVSGNGPDNYRVVLTDMDGIKQYLGKSEKCQLQGLWHLAASVMGLAGVSRTDYVRMFRVYCDKLDMPKERREDIFHELARKAEAKYRSRAKS